MSSINQNQIRILHITECLSAAGIESFIMNNYRKMDRSKVQFDFLILRNQEEFYDSEIQSLGGHKYTICKNDNNTLVRILKESRELYHFLCKHPYHIIHIHYTTPLRAPYLFAAKKAGVPVRIYHSHSAEVSGKSKMKIKIYNFMRKKIEKWATHYFACSNAAAAWIFPEKLCTSHQVKVIYNGIDIQKYSYHESYRKEIREELNIGEAFTMVHTGRFLEQKNHTFIIDVFTELKKKCPKAILLLLGEGELKQSIEEMVMKRNLTDSVHFLNVRSDVHKILSASDCYIMPSLYEGLPVAAVEAECSSLPCVLSTNITNEIELTDKVSFLSLTDSAEIWADEILKYKGCTRKDESQVIAQHGYDANQVAQSLQEFYCHMEKKYE